MVTTPALKDRVAGALLGLSGLGMTAVRFYV